MKIKVGVIFGGESVEHEVSIITATQAMKSIDRDKYEVVPIYIAKDKTWYTGHMLEDIEVYKDFNDLKRYAKKVVLVKTARGFELQRIDGLFKRTVAFIDIAFPMVHGKGVEDGSLAGLLETIGIPFCMSNTLASSLGQDKVVQKQILNAQKINTPKYTWFYDSDYTANENDIKNNIKSLGFPVIVKPSRLGSSVGIRIANNEEELDKAINEAIKYDEKIIVEEVIDNLKEVNIAVLGNSEYQETSSIVEMRTQHNFLTFEDKYISSGKKKGFTKGTKSSSSNMLIDAKLNPEIEEKVRKMAIETFKVLNMSGVVRIDMLINDKTGEVYINEPNTIPGSLSFYMWKNKGKDYKTLLDEIISLGIKEYKKNYKKTTSFESNILSNYNGSKGVKGLKNKIS